jgi:phosphate transport system protein
VAVQLAVVARFYERIGDHAVNISEKVRYLVNGWMPEHVGAVRHRLRSDHTPAAGVALPGGSDLLRSDDEG